MQTKDSSVALKDESMLRCAPEFADDAEYGEWLDFIHAEIQDEGENDADYCEKR